MLEPFCKNCLLYDRPHGRCRVAILIDGEQQFMPVEPNDFCHYEELGIKPEMVRWFVDDSGSKPVVKMEYPEFFFTPKEEK